MNSDTTSGDKQKTPRQKNTRPEIPKGIKHDTPDDCIISSGIGAGGRIYERESDEAAGEPSEDTLRNCAAANIETDSDK